MNTEEYTNNAVRTESPNFHINKVNPRHLHAVLGICTEAGELQDAVKRALYYGKDLDTVNIEEELGDLMWYIALACEANNLSLETIMEKNIAKLKARFPDKFTDELALNRDLNNERQVLEADPSEAA